jgi:regulator of sirC expression with transglutaminase-like and TPR domain|tara:strand:+ start:1224 stop:1478 length:255 start_codon:yes stop_codon:yes gene_type:complete
MNKVDIERWRLNVDSRLEELTIMNAKQSSQVTHIKETTDEIKTLVKEQNGRVRALESSVSRIQGVGSMFVVVFGSLISWLFKGE